MIKLIASFLKNTPDERSRFCSACSIWGIILNVFLFALKFTIGSITGALSVTADGLNNLSDSASSLITLLGIKLASKKPDPKHPFGHGRIEYMSGIIVSVLIILMGVELLKSGISSVLHPSVPEINAVVFISLSVSICIKLYMFIYNRKYGKQFNSAAMTATATDCISDCISTAVVLICMLITMLCDINIDGYCSIAVSVLIIRAGIKSVFETIQPLLGKAPDAEFVEEIKKIVLAPDKIIGIHDLIVHDYGPGRSMISLHAEVPADGNIIELHDIIDNTEKKLYNELGTHATIHMDPIETSDTVTLEYKKMVENILLDIDKKIHFHDFRIVRGTTHTNLIFDILVPYNYKIKDEELVDLIQQQVREKNRNLFCVINVDKDYTAAL